MWSLGYIYDTIFGKYGEMHITTAPALNHSRKILYFLNGVSIAPKEAKMVRLAMQDPWTNKLTAADFVDLDRVKRILERVYANERNSEY